MSSSTATSTLSTASTTSTDLTAHATAGPSPAPAALSGGLTPRVVGEPRVLDLLGNRLELLVEHDVFPRASLVRYTVAPGFAAPPQLHHHVTDDVLMVVLEGQLVVTGTDGPSLAGPGEVVVLQHGTPFAWRNGSTTEQAVYLAVYAPGGFEQYFVAVQRAVAASGRLSPDVVAALWQQYGIAVSAT